MDKKCEVYIEMVKIVNDIYKKYKKDYTKTLEIIKKYNKNDNDIINELIDILKYVKKLYISYEKRIKDIDGKYKIKYGVDRSYNNLIEIYKDLIKGNEIEIELMIMIIIPSITIKMNNGYEIIDYNIGSTLNKKILKMINEEEFQNEGCPICFEKFNKLFTISNCCCYKCCIRCFNLIAGKCAICKEENPIIIKI
jgi:hypothetical protein